jgi:Uma2 family endonuclease
MARIGLEDHGRSMTLDEFLEAEVVEGYRYELLRGLLIAEEIPEEDHGQVISNLYMMFGRHSHGQPGLIFRYGGAANFLLCLPKSGSAMRPDAGVVFRGSPSDPQGHRRPILVAEVVSESSVDRDYRTKREEYLAYGILEYWIIDLVIRKMTVLVRNGDVWVERPCVEGQPIPSLVLPGLAATVADLWVDLDEYGAEVAS